MDPEPPKNKSEVPLSPSPKHPSRTPRVLRLSVPALHAITLLLCSVWPHPCIIVLPVYQRSTDVFRLWTLTLPG